LLATIGAYRPALRRSAIVLVGAGTALWACATSYLWFSGVMLAYGKPNETVVAEEVAADLAPGTLVVADLWHGYGRGKLTYLLSATLRDRDKQPLFWYIVDSDHALRDVMEDPRRSVAY